MKIDLPEEYVPLVIEALEHYYAYTRAKQHEDVRYQDAADWFKIKPSRLSSESHALFAACAAKTPEASPRGWSGPLGNPQPESAK